MFASIKKIFAKDQDGERSPTSVDGFKLVESPQTPDPPPGKKDLGTPSQALNIPRQASTTHEKVVDSDDDDVPTKLVSMSCPVPRNKVFVPHRPSVKPTAAPLHAKLPNLELPPSLPSDYVIPEPVKPPQENNGSFVEYVMQHAASCPPTFRLVVDAQGVCIPDANCVHLEATPMANSPLIYEVLVSGCLFNPVQKTRLPSPPTSAIVDRSGDLATGEDQDVMKDEDELPEMEL